MPIVEPIGSRVLVTGANGFLGMWVVRILLEQGYLVRAVVRALEKGKRLQEYFRSYGNKIELFVVEDVMKDGAFDEAVKGVDAIVHTASPATFAPVEPDDYIKPAIQGTLGILESARKTGDKVKRIVITSSVVAIYNSVTKPVVVFDETQWGDEAIQVVREKGRDADPLVKYSASKTLAEKAAWEYYEQHKRNVEWDLVVLNPSFIWGPPLQDFKKSEDLNESLLILWNMITNDQADEVLKETFSLVHVRDAALAHVLALRKEAAGGERILVAGESLTWQATRDLIHSLKPELYTSKIFSRGNPNLENVVSYKYNPAKSNGILGLNYASAEEVFRDILQYFQQRGWLQISDKK